MLLFAVKKGQESYFNRPSIKEDNTLLNTLPDNYKSSPVQKPYMIAKKTIFLL